MSFIVSSKEFENYCISKDAHVKKLFESSGSKYLKRDFVSQTWHLESASKRFIYNILYGKHLRSDAPKNKILDVGGNITGISALLSRKHDYSLLDIGNYSEKDLQDIGPIKLINNDWYNHSTNEVWDTIICNDIFPNVDQRLKLFLDTYLPKSKCITLSLTFFNNTEKWYPVKRLDGDETLYMSAWSGDTLKRLLEDYYDNIIEPYNGASTKFMGQLSEARESIFPNNRQVCIVNLKGGLYDKHA